MVLKSVSKTDEVVSLSVLKRNRKENMISSRSIKRTVRMAHGFPRMFYHGEAVGTHSLLQRTCYSGQGGMGWNIGPGEWSNSKRKMLA